MQPFAVDLDSTARPARPLWSWLALVVAAVAVLIAARPPASSFPAEVALRRRKRPPQALLQRELRAFAAAPRQTLLDKATVSEWREWPEEPGLWARDLLLVSTGCTPKTCFVGAAGRWWHAPRWRPRLTSTPSSPPRPACSAPASARPLLCALCAARQPPTCAAALPPPLSPPPNPRLAPAAFSGPRVPRPAAPCSPRARASCSAPRLLAVGAAVARAVWRPGRAAAAPADARPPRALGLYLGCGLALLRRQRARPRSATSAGNLSAPSRRARRAALQAHSFFGLPLSARLGFAAPFASWGGLNQRTRRARARDQQPARRARRRGSLPAADRGLGVF